LKEYCRSGVDEVEVLELEERLVEAGVDLGDGTQQLVAEDAAQDGGHLQE
jgi:hypothetical protein